MTNYYFIFVTSVAVNIGISMYSSDYWKKILQRYGMGHLIGLPNTSSNESLTSTLLTGHEAGDNETTETRTAYQKLLMKYLLVYLLATFSDWLQGPYVYALYSDYGYSQHDIAVLFVAGFGSSMIFGSFVGGMADWGGRRLFVVLFAIIYAASCFTKHFKHFGILMIGRLLGGIATSLLFSVFEAWLVRAHADAGCKQYLSNSFGWAAYGNSIIAIMAGLIANNAANSFSMEPMFGNVYLGGYLNPFDISLCTLLVCGFFAFTKWEENYGENTGNSKNESSEGEKDTEDQKDTPDSHGPDSHGDPTKWYAGLKNALVVTMRSREILLCGIISSIFEGSMYIFVFMWTPALTGPDSDVKLPFGVIFSTFMVCCMAGSTLFSCLCEGKLKFINNGDPIKMEQLAIYEFAAAGAAMTIIALSGENTTLKFIAMNLFEVVVGMYWPTMGTLKSNIVPEDKRAAIYNLYRIPLNFIVLFSLLTDLTPTTSFTLNAVLLAIATGCQYNLHQLRMKFMGSSTSKPIDDKEETTPLTSTTGTDEEGMTDVAV